MIKNPRHRQGAVVWHSPRVARHERPSQGMTVWITGLSGAGKSTLAFELERLLIQTGRPSYCLDGDNIRHHLNADLGFSMSDRSESVRRIGEVARIMADAGFIAIVAAISPLREDRSLIRLAHEANGLLFWEVHMATPIEVCEQRDPKGLYSKARAGRLSNFTGVNHTYEAPTAPEFVLTSDTAHPSAAAKTLHSAVESSLRGQFLGHGATVSQTFDSVAQQSSDTPTV